MSCRGVSVCLSVGLEPTGNVVGAPARFTVETSAAGTGELEVVVLNPKGTPEKVLGTWLWSYSSPRALQRRYSGLSCSLTQVQGHSREGTWDLVVVVINPKGTPEKVRGT